MLILSPLGYSTLNVQLKLATVKIYFRFRGFILVREEIKKETFFNIKLFFVAYPDPAQTSTFRDEQAILREQLQEQELEVG